MMKVKLIAHTPNPEKVVAAAAKLCYSNAQIDTLLEGLTEEKSKEFVENKESSKINCVKNPAFASLFGLFKKN